MSQLKPKQHAARSHFRLRESTTTVTFRVVGAAEVDRALPTREVIETLGKAYRINQLPNSTKKRFGLTHGELLVMTSSSDKVAGVKLLTINPSNPEQDRPLFQSGNVLFSSSLKPVAIIDEAALIGLRTAAVSGRPGCGTIGSSARYSTGARERPRRSPATTSGMHWR